MKTPHLVVNNLKTLFHVKQQNAFVHAVDGVDLTVNKGETVGIVGESGSGKSITMLSLMGLLDSEPGIIDGSATLFTKSGEIKLLDDLSTYTDYELIDGRLHVTKDVDKWQRIINKRMAHIRGKEISIIFQNPRAALNPFETIGNQIYENIRLHTNLKSRQEIKEKAYSWLEKVKIDSPRLRYNNYPYGLSGGMCQRAMVAMALSSEPSLLIADEPTTGLDATVQAKILDLLQSLQQELGISLILISHDIGVISRLSTSITVMYSGLVVEQGPSRTILDTHKAEKHPYTRALLSSIPSSSNLDAKGYLPSIKGELPNNLHLPEGCRFYDRCQKITPEIREKCRNVKPPLVQVEQEHTIRCWLYKPA